MSSRGRGLGRRGRGSGSNPYHIQNPFHTEFPGLSAALFSKKWESSQRAKDVLLTPPEPYLQNIVIEETVLYINTEDEQWMTDPWEIKRRYLTTQHSPLYFDLYRYIFEQILVETASVEFKHTLDDPNWTASPINYIKATIQKIMPKSLLEILEYYFSNLDWIRIKGLPPLCSRMDGLGIKYVQA